MTSNLLLGVLILLVVVLLAAVVSILLRKPQAVSPSTDLSALSTTLQNLAQSIQQGHAQTAVLSEKMGRLDSVVPAINSVQVEMKALSERVSKVEGNQTQAQQYLTAVGNGISQTGTMTKSLVEATAAMRSELSLAKNNLTELQTQAKARHEVEHRTSESIRRLESVIAGTHSKGAAGENILEAVFANLPTDWQVRDFQVNGKPCEFGLRLPNNLVLPIDSKWAATHLLEQFIASTDLAEQQKLKTLIQRAVLLKAGEVKKYIDPSKTVNFGVAAVPDAIYDLCCGTLCEAFDMNVVIISYSMFVPYLLLVFQTTLKTSQNVDLEKLDRDLRHASTMIADLEKEVDGRWSTAITMLSNGRDGMRVNLGRLRQLPSLQLNGSNALESASEPPLDFNA
jgi:DNA recombination protein RmuC